MNFVKHRILVLLAVVFLCTVFLGEPVVSAQEESSGAESFFDELPSEAYDLAAKQDAALEAYDAIVSQFGMSPTGVPDYPDFWAGEYIDDDNRLVVLVTSLEALQKSPYYAVIENNPVVVVREVAHSYKELVELRQVAAELAEKGIIAVSSYVDVIRNRFIIGISEADLTRHAATLEALSQQYPIIFEAEQAGIALAATSTTGSLQAEETSHTSKSSPILLIVAGCLAVVAAGIFVYARQKKANTVYSSTSKGSIN